MIKSLTLLGCFCILALFGNAQQLTVNSQVIFGSVTEITPDSSQITFTNNSGQTIAVTGYRFYNTYGVPAFSTSALNISIANGSSQNIWIKFSPLHNIYHNSELVIFTDAHRGTLHVDLQGQGHYSNSYYDQSENLEEEALKTTLQTITGAGYISLGYSNAARDYMFMTLDNKLVNGQGAIQNTIECVYTGREAIGYVTRVDCQTNSNFNTEHTFPQALFNSNEPMKSDLFHLFPTDDVANNTRASYPFGMVINPTWTVGGSKYAAGIFEPRDAHKGEVARAMLYFVMRYQNYNNFLNTQESILKQWHQQFPPTVVETTRANNIFTQQNNRNPFIDYPQLVDRISSFSTTSVAASNFSLDLVQDTIDYGTVVNGVSNLYQFMIVNNGNQPIDFTSFTIQPSNQLVFNAPFNGSPVTLQPGESLPILFTLSTLQTGPFNGTLEINTNSISQPLFTIPIIANAVVTGLIENKNPNGYTTFPNPFNNHICISPSPSAKAIIRLFDVEGRVLQTSTGADFQSCEIISNDLNSGVYMLEIKDGATISRKVLVKE